MQKPSKHEKTSDQHRERFGEEEPRHTKAEHETRSFTDDRTQLIESHDATKDDVTAPSADSGGPRPDVSSADVSHADVPRDVVKVARSSPGGNAPRDFELGEEGKRYADWKLIGEGAFGVVYRARDTRLQRDVAIKILKRDAPTEFHERFLDEARSLAGLNHSGICRVYDYGQTETSYLVTEWLPGPALDDTPLPMEAAEACRLVAEIADAIAFAHRHEVIHRDLKPANVVIDGHGRPRVIDFGLAAHEDDLTSSGRQFSGSPAYMSPEQTTGKLHLIDARSDIWALGVVLYELVTGKRPFRGTRSEDLLSKIREKPTPPARVYNDHVPAQLETVIARCLQKNPEDRFATASELSIALTKVVDEVDSGDGCSTTATDEPSGLNLRLHHILTISMTVICAVVIGSIWVLRSGDSSTGSMVTNVDAAKEESSDLAEVNELPKVRQSDIESPSGSSLNSFVVEGVQQATGNRWSLSRDEPVAPNIHVGDRISLHVRLANRRHVYLIWLGADSGITPLYPGPIGSTSHVGDPELDRPIDQLSLPVGTITPTPSTETVLMIATDEPFEDSAELRKLLAVLPRPRLTRWAANGNTRGVHFDADSWEETTSTDAFLREAFQPLNEFVEQRFGESVTIQTVSFISGIQ
ncbi:MAG: protein kinase [Planctomycetota bacterium]